jgi:hypothetical protein
MPDDLEDEPDPMYPEPVEGPAAVTEPAETEERA